MGVPWEAEDEDEDVSIDFCVVRFSRRSWRDDRCVVAGPPAASLVFSCGPRHSKIRSHCKPRDAGLFIVLGGISFQYFYLIILERVSVIHILFLDLYL